MRRARTQDVRIVPKPELDWASECARPLARDSTRLGGCTFTCSVRVPSKAGSRSVVIAVPPDGKDLIVARHRLMIEPTMDYTAAATLKRFPLLSGQGSLSRKKKASPSRARYPGRRRAA